MEQSSRIVELFEAVDKSNISNTIQDWIKLISKDDISINVLLCYKLEEPTVTSVQLTDDFVSTYLQTNTNALSYMFNLNIANVEYRSAEPGEPVVQGQSVKVFLTNKELRRALIMSKKPIVTTYFEIVKQANICQALYVQYCKNKHAQDEYNDVLALNQNYPALNFRADETRRIISCVYEIGRLPRRPYTGIMYVYEQQPPRHQNYKFIFCVFQSRVIQEFLESFNCYTKNTFNPTIIYLAEPGLNSDAIKRFLQKEKLLVKGLFDTRLNLLTFTTNTNYTIDHVIRTINKMLIV